MTSQWQSAQIQCNKSTTSQSLPFYPSLSLTKESFTHTDRRNDRYDPTLSSSITNAPTPSFTFDPSNRRLWHRPKARLRSPNYGWAAPGTIRVGPERGGRLITRPPGTSWCHRRSSRSPGPRVLRSRRGSAPLRFSSPPCSSPTTWRWGQARCGVVLVLLLEMFGC